MSNHRPTSKRTPSILVTDVRYAQGSRAPFAKTSAGSNKSLKHSTNFNDISIDNILSDVSDIPSAQRRPGSTGVDIRRFAGTKGWPVSGTIKGINNHNNSGTVNSGSVKGSNSGNTSNSTGSRVAAGFVPPRMRTSKVTQRLVLIPDELEPDHLEPLPDGVPIEPPPIPYPNEEFDDLPKRTYAERLPRDRRAEKFPRVTAYCISDGIRLNEAAEFLKSHHKIRPRIYDEALYAPYYLPLLPGDGQGSRVKSSPGGIMILEQLINQSEQVDHHYEYFSGLETNNSGSIHHGQWNENEEFDPSEPQDFTPPRSSGVESAMESGIDSKNYERDETSDSNDQVHNDNNLETLPTSQRDEHSNLPSSTSIDKENLPNPSSSHSESINSKNMSNSQQNFESFTSSLPLSSPPTTSIPGTHSPKTERPEVKVNEQHREPPPDDLKHAEMFIFSYGVIVFWNFTEPQEKDILADLTFARVPDIKGTRLLKTLVIRPINDQEMETEEMHFNYSPNTNKPRIYNDMITLKSGDHMIKLSMSHAIAQSTKLSRFEARMDVNMHDVKHVPKMLALTGNLGMKREEVLKISGKLFKLRVDVNLSSNVLDTPDFFWEAEPSLNPLYSAVRQYLEIDQRILVLNERCKVFLELADIIAGSIAESNMSRITWIIIGLIALSLGVSTVEIALRYVILQGD